MIQSYFFNFNKCLHKHKGKQKKTLRRKKKKIKIPDHPHLNTNNVTDTPAFKYSPKYLHSKFHCLGKFFGDACKKTQKCLEVMLIRTSSHLNIEYLYQAIYISFKAPGLTINFHTPHHIQLPIKRIFLFFLSSQLLINLLEEFIEGTIYFRKE